MYVYLEEARQEPGRPQVRRIDAEVGTRWHPPWSYLPLSVPQRTAREGRMKTRVTKKQYCHLPTLKSAHGPDDDEEDPLEAGEVVAIVRDNSTATTPKITFGRVIK